MRSVALVASGAAVIGLTACTNAAAPGSTAASRTAAVPIVPVSCGQQYRSWVDGAGKGLMGALDAVASAAAAGDRRGVTRALSRAKPAVAAAAEHPIPACADPRGFWNVLLMHVNAAAAGGATASSIHAALTDVPRIHQQLIAEVKQVV